MPSNLTIFQTAAVAFVITALGILISTMFFSWLFDLVSRMKERTFVNANVEAPPCVRCKTEPRAPYKEPTVKRRWKSYCKRCAIEIAINWKRRNRARHSEIQREYHKRKKVKDAGEQKEVQ